MQDTNTNNANNTKTSLVKMIYVASIGPLIVTMQEETTDALVVKNPCQFGLDEGGNLVVRDYLEGISNPEKPVTFMKYNIVSVSEPESIISDVYVKALEELQNPNKPQIFMPPEKKIIR